MDLSSFTMFRIFVEDISMRVDVRRKMDLPDGASK